MPLDNGASRDMTLDYSEFAIKAKLGEIEALPSRAARARSLAARGIH
jgi:hypothetical protein